MAEWLQIVKDACPPPWVLAAGILAILALWKQLWKCHRREEEVIDRVLSDARARERGA